MINSLNQAEEMLRENNIVHVSPSNREYVEGKQLLDVCGYSYSEATTNGRQKSQARKVLERQIKKHQFTEYVDYESQKVGRAIEYRFTLNAANHVLLAAMTQQGKDARELAIGLVQDTLEDNQLGINPESAYVGIARFMAGYDDGKKTKWKESYKAVINNKGVYQATVEFIESTSSKAVNGLRKEDRAELLHKAESFIKLEKTTYRKTSDDFNITEYNDYDKACLLLSNRRNRVLSRRVTELTK